MKSHGTMNKTTRGAGMSRLRRFIFLLAAPILALSMAGCNGRVFSSLPGDDLLNQLFPFLMGGGPATLVSIEVAPAVKSIPAGFKVQYYATGIYSDNTIVDMTSLVTWDVNALLLEAEIDANGLLTANNTGNFTVSASTGGFTGTADLEITAATLDYIYITATEDKEQIADGTSIQFTATGYFSDYSSLDLTTQVTWDSTDFGVLDISNDPGTEGQATGVDPGTVTVQASIGAVDSNEYDIEVTNATIVSIHISPTDPDVYVIAYGTTLQFTCLGTFSDSSTQDLTDQVTWSTSDGLVATIDASGLATTTGTGETEIEAVYLPGDPLEATDSTTLGVEKLTLQSIEISASSSDINPGETLQYTAMGTYGTGANQVIRNITTQVVWSSSDPSVATISNGSGTNGIATGISGGTVTIRAQSGSRFDTETLTVNASDEDDPTMESARLLSGNRVKVKFSEPMDPTLATNASYYEVILSVNEPGNCLAGTNFVGTPGDITSVSFLSQDTYIIQLAGGTSVAEYMVIGDRANLADLAGNTLYCPNNAVFDGVDTIEPYLVSVTNEGDRIIVKFSEPMTIGGADGADNISNYDLSEHPDNLIPGDDVTIDTVERLDPADDTTFLITLDKTTISPPTVAEYRLEVYDNVSDQAVAPNSMGSPRILYFEGNEQLKVVSAEATDTTHIKVYFNKPVTELSSECSSEATCRSLYKLYPREDPDPLTPSLIGFVTLAERGSSPNADHIVTLTHNVAQDGIAYTVVVANGKDGDGFTNGSTSIEASSNGEDVQATPKDRAPFVGKGDVNDKINDGAYYQDPFADDTSFNFAFTHDGKVYLAPNTYSETAFRFDPDGLNSVLVTFDADLKTCTSAKGLGWGTASTNGCQASDGFNEEDGIVGFTNGSVTIGGNTHSLLMVGPLIWESGGIKQGYLTEDTDTKLNWRKFTWNGTGGNNTRSMQLIHAFNDPSNNAWIFAAASSDHGTQAPSASFIPLSEDADDLVTPGAPFTCDTMAGTNYIGKNGTTYLGSNTYAGSDAVIGIDAVVEFNGYLYLGNPCGITYTDGTLAVTAGGREFDSLTNCTPSGFGTSVTLVLPDGDTGLGKISPGQRGVPKFLEYNGKLYMARNVATGTSTPDYYTPDRGELWVCDPGLDDICASAEWTQIVFGTEDELKTTGVVTAKRISMLQNNGDNTLFIGFDDEDASQGVRIFRVSGEPAATDGSTLASASWVQQGNNGLRIRTEVGPPEVYQNLHLTKIFSSVYTTDGMFDYIYLTAGNGTDSILVFRQRE